MVVRRAIMMVCRGTWSHEYNGFVFSVNENGPTSWFFVPDAEKTSGLNSFYLHKVRIRGPGEEKKFQPEAAILINRDDADEMAKNIIDALSGLL